MPKVIPVFVTVMLLTSITPAKQGAIVAVFDMEDRNSGLSEQVRLNLTDYLAVLLAEGGYQVVPRSQIRERLASQKKESYKSCYDQTCQVELGRELAAQKSLSTQVFGIGGECRLAGSLYDLKKATTDKAASARAACTEKDMLRAVEILAAKLCEGALSPEDIAAIEEARRKKRARAEAKKKRLEQEKKHRMSDAAEKKKREREEQKPQKAPVEEKPTSSDFDDGAWKVGFKVGLLGADLTGDLMLHIEKAQDNILSTNVASRFGLFLDFAVDYQLGRIVSLGGFSHYFHMMGIDSDHANTHEGYMDFLAFGARLKGSLALTDTLALRLGISLGPGFILNSPVYRLGESPDGDHDITGTISMAIQSNLELAWYLTEVLCVTFELGMLSYPIGTVTDDSGGGSYTLNVRLPMLLYMAVGTEYGL